MIEARVILAVLAGVVFAGLAEAQIPEELAPDYCLAVYEIEYGMAAPGEASAAARRKNEDFYPFATAAMGEDAFGQDYGVWFRELSSKADSGAFDYSAAIAACDEKWGSLAVRQEAIASGAYKPRITGDGRIASAPSAPMFPSPSPSVSYADSRCAKLDSDATSLMDSYVMTLTELAAGDDEDAPRKARDSYERVKMRLENYLIDADQYGCTQLARDFQQVLSELPRP